MNIVKPTNKILKPNAEHDCISKTKPKEMTMFNSLLVSAKRLEDDWKKECEAHEYRTTQRLINLISELLFVNLVLLTITITLLGYMYFNLGLQ